MSSSINELHEMCMLESSFFIHLLYFRQRLKIKTRLNTKQDMAKQRKYSLEIGKKITKMKQEIDHFMEHTAFRKKTFAKNIKICEQFKQEHRKNLEVNCRYNSRFKSFESITITCLNCLNHRSVKFVYKKLKNTTKMN